MKQCVFLVAVALTASASAIAQTYDLQFVEVQNTGSVFDVTVQIKSSGGTFRMGSGNLVLTYATAVLGPPTLLAAHAFSGGLYAPMSVTLPAPGRVSVNIEYNGTAGQGTLVPGTYADVLTLRFPVLDLTGNGLLRWRTVAPNATNVFQDDNSSLVAIGTLHNLDEPLPVQLVGFAGTVIGPGTVRLDWGTLSETNNYGFAVERASAPAGFAALPGAFLPGYGTTVIPRQYRYVDSTAGVGTRFYRLKQYDLDGTVHYSDGILVDVVAGVAERPLPSEFALGQNYPNPFNPATLISYAVPRSGRVTLEVFTLLGERVATPVDEVQEAGYYAVQFDGAGLASGVYLYRLQAGDLRLMKRMLLVK